MIPVMAILLFAACQGGSRKDSLAVLNDKKTELEKLKSEREKLDKQIESVQAEITRIDGGASNQKPKLVATEKILEAGFNHFIELQGKVDAENISFVAPRGGGGQIKEILVRQGQQVSKGQLLMRLDNSVQRQNVVAAQQGLESIRTQLRLAENVYERQKNLWEKNIGTEVELLRSKAQVDGLRNQLATSQQQVRVLQEQANSANVYADVSGVADQVTVRVGELFTGSPMGGGVIKIVNTSNLKAVSNIPENYMASIKIGMPVEVEIPDLNKTIETKVSFVGASIDPTTRGFNLEARLPKEVSLKPNMLAKVKIKDYVADSVITVPVNTLQNDENGKFVMVAVTENNKMVARKKPVTIGLITGDRLEIKSGINGGDVIITEGFQNLYDGQLITTGA